MFNSTVYTILTMDTFIFFCYVLKLNTSNRKVHSFLIYKVKIKINLCSNHRLKQTQALYSRPQTAKYQNSGV